MRGRATIAALALLTGALLLSDQSVLAGNCGNGALANAATCPSGRITLKGWIYLHRPDGEVVYIKADQIVFVMSAANMGSSQRARSKLQLANGFCDVIESVDEVMEAIRRDASFV